MSKISEKMFQIKEEAPHDLKQKKYFHIATINTAVTGIKCMKCINEIESLREIEEAFA